ncbi:TATA box-binding protein-associated factor RNA polymerase I subunit A-like isoform X2 [Styela clava]
MEGIASQPLGRSAHVFDIFRNVGNEVIFNHPVGKYETDLVTRHKQAQKVHGSFSNPVHILYEYVLYLMVKKDFQSAKEALAFFQSSFKSYHCSRVTIENWMDFWSPVLEGYLGMLDFLSWKEMGSNLQSTFLLTENDQEQSVRTLTAERAIQRFEITLQSPGVWDMFIQKYVTMLEDMGRIEAAEEVLRSNSCNNPENPNAHKYWYEFLLRHSKIDITTENKIESLTRLRGVASSDIYMIDLHCLKMNHALTNFDEKVKFVTEVSLAHSILMDMLDYEDLMNDEKAWGALAKSLRTVKDLKSDAFKKMLQDLWYTSKRHIWWPKYHFTKFRANQALNSSSSLAMSKSYVASLLVGKKCEFCNIIKAQL